MSRKLCLLLCALLSLVVSPLYGQRYSRGLIPQVLAERNGLHRAWFTQVRLNPARGRISAVSTHISSTQALNAFEVVDELGSQVITERHLNAFGEPMGRDQAEQRAKELAEKLKSRGRDAKVVSIVSPEITLYVTTDRGVIQAIDGENGETKWTAIVPEPELVTLPATASDQYVATVNGNNVILLSATDGKLLWSRRVEGGAPGGGCVIVGDYVFVPTLGGVVEGYQLEDSHAAPLIHKSYGAIFTRPISGSDHVLWATAKGHVNVAGVKESGVSFRIETNSEVMESPAYAAPNRVLAATEAGFVYCASESNSKLLWRYSASEPLMSAPVVVGDQVYVTSTSGMHAIDLSSGTRRWKTMVARNFLAADDVSVFATDRVGRLIMLNRETGSQTGVLDVPEMDLQIANRLTDRVYIGMRSGLIQCLRRTGRAWPMIHVGIEEEKPAEAQEEKPAAEPMPKADNPFGAAPAGNPFKVNGNPFKADDNPFK